MVNGYCIGFPFIYQVVKQKACERWDDGVSFKVSPVLNPVDSHALQVWCLSKSASVGVSNDFQFTFPIGKVNRYS